MYIFQYLKKYNIISDQQYCFKKGIPTPDATAKVITKIHPKCRSKPESN